MELVEAWGSDGVEFEVAKHQSLLLFPFHNHASFSNAVMISKPLFVSKAVAHLSPLGLTQLGFEVRLHLHFIATRINPLLEDLGPCLLPSGNER